MYYFAYGSNMLTARLAQRVPAVAPVGPARLGGYALHFHLRGGDGSGKCNIVATQEPAVVHGVLFELDPARLDWLHAAEGPAYDFLELPVHARNGLVAAAVYRGRPEWLDDSLVPFDWYMRFVVGGAAEHGLPEPYVQWLAGVATQTDPDDERARNNRRIRDGQPDNVRRAGEVAGRADVE